MQKVLCTLPLNHIVSVTLLCSQINNSVIISMFHESDALESEGGRLVVLAGSCVTSVAFL